MIEGQFDFWKALVVPPYSGRGRPRTVSGQEQRQKAAAAAARRSALDQLSPAARAERTAATKERERKKRKRWDAARYKRDPEKVKDGARRSYKKHFPARAKTAAESYRRNLIRGMIGRAERRAAEKGLPFNLTVNDVVIPDFCPVLGIPMMVRGDAKAGCFDRSPTLDRIDNSGGYVVGNICVISWRANRIKGDATLAEIEKIIAYMRQGGP